MQEFLHEEISRGKEALEKFASFHIVLCGVGAIGSNLAENLARQGFRNLTLIDFDRIEGHNVGTQAYYSDSIGKLKTPTLQFQLYRIAKARVVDWSKELTIDNAKSMLNGASLVVDSFDRSEARRIVKRLCQTEYIPCLHVGLSEDYAEIVWDKDYRVPKERGVDICDYPLSRNIVMLAVVVTSETVVRYALTGEMKSYHTTLKDFSIEEFGRE